MLANISKDMILHLHIEIRHQHDIIGSKIYLICLQVECLFPRKHSLKFCKNLDIFHQDMKENVSQCFFLNTVCNHL